MARMVRKALFVLPLLGLSLISCQEKPGKEAAPGSGVVVKVDNAVPKAPPPAQAGVEAEVVVLATLDGKPAEKAKVTVGGADLGETDASGRLAKVVKRKAGEEVPVVVTMEAPGLRVKPWNGSFVVRLPKDNAVVSYPLSAALEATRTVTLSVSEKGKPVAGAVVRVKGKEAGKTDEKGEFVYEYRDVPKGGVAFEVAAAGYAPWRSTAKTLTPGQTVSVPLSKQTVLKVTALVTEYGTARGIRGVAVTVDGKAAGTTGPMGTLVHTYRGKPGRKIAVALSAPGHVPSAWETRVETGGEVAVVRHFTPASPLPVRVAVVGFSGNTPGVDLSEASSRAEEAFRKALFAGGGFREVSPDLAKALRKSRLSVEKATTKGWRGTTLAGIADVLIVGSVSRDPQGTLVEVRFHGADGRPVIALVERVAGEGDVAAAGREIALAAVDRYPFEGAVTAVAEGRSRINLGKAAHGVAKGAEFDLSAPVADATGKIARYRPVGFLRATKVEKDGALAVPEDLKPGEAVEAGMRVVRYVPRPGEGVDAFVLDVRGGAAPDAKPLGGVNVYLDGAWAGTTGDDGKISVPARRGKNYALLLYRHGFRQTAAKVRVDAPGETKSYLLEATNSLFKLETEPPGAEVSVDGASVGRSPLAAGVPVPLGFHTVRISAGADYRDFEEVVEFGRDVEDYTGARRIALRKDVLSVAGRALKAGRPDEAIRTLSGTEKDHPDYSEARTLLAQTYMDAKGDYAAAVREYESVLALPQNRQLLYKQYAVAFANLGRAYYERGNETVGRDREAAAGFYTKALQNLQTARQNVRFFPAGRHDEALHDTYYYTALATHKLYLVTRKPALQESAENAWREYFDFFPESLQGRETYERSREAARKYQEQIKGRI